MWDASSKMGFCWKAVASGIRLSEAEGLGRAKGGRWVTFLGHATARGRRDPSCLYNVGRSEVVTLTLRIIKFKPVSARVTSVAQEARNSQGKNSGAV